MISSKRYAQAYIEIILIILAAVISYGSIVRNEFVFDDFSTIVNNKLIIDWKNIHQLFSKDYFASGGMRTYTRSGEASYRPLVTLSYFVDYHIWGLNSHGFHATNLLLHILTAIIFYLFSRQLVINKFSSFLAAMLYAVHPVVSETVNCISFREDILCALFTYSALWASYRIARGNTIIVSISLLLALFSKEMGMVFFPILLILDRFHFSYDFRKRYLLYLAVSACCIFYLIIRFNIMRNEFEPSVPFPEPGMTSRLLIIARITGHYLMLCLYPINFSIDYYIPLFVDVTSQHIISLIVLSAILIFLFYTLIRSIVTHTKAKDITIFLSLFFISLLPALNIIPLKNIIADRYLYLPFGFMALFLSLLFDRHIVHRYFNIVVVSYAVVLCMLSIARSHDWMTSYNLWNSALRENAFSFHANNNLAGWYKDHNMIERSISYYKKALQLRPDDPIPYFNLGNSYKEIREFGRAIYYYRKAASLSGTDPEPYVNMATAYMELNQIDNAAEALREAIRIAPKSSAAHNNYGVILSEQGKLEEAVIEHKRAINYDNRNENAFFNLALCYIDLKEYQQALKIFHHLIQLNDSYPQVYYFIGFCFESAGNAEQARKFYKKALEINPEDKAALKKLRNLSH
ncbi:MAG: tetratricopeptide repeat protein [Candidatus Auribacterota bacterium]